MSFFKNLFKSSEQIAAEKAVAAAELSAFFADIEPLLRSVWDKTMKGPYTAETHIAHQLAKNHAFARDVWRRTVALAHLLDEGARPANTPSIDNLAKLNSLAAKHYYELAPSTLYGQKTLQISDLQLKKEKDAVLSKRDEERECFIYKGTTPDGRVYIGQTTNSPERRYIQHRQQQTGPFKTGEVSVRWEVVQQCRWDDADYWEAFYIGLYQSDTAGYNDTCGNSDQGRLDGKAARPSVSNRK